MTAGRSWGAELKRADVTSNRARLGFWFARRARSDGRRSRTSVRRRRALFERRLSGRIRHIGHPRRARDDGALRRAPFLSASARSRCGSPRFDGWASAAPVLGLRRCRSLDRGGLCRLSVDRISFRQDRFDRADLDPRSLFARHGGRRNGRSPPRPPVRSDWHRRDDPCHLRLGAQRPPSLPWRPGRGDDRHGAVGHRHGRPGVGDARSNRAARACFATGHRLWHFAGVSVVLQGAALAILWRVLWSTPGRPAIRGA